MRKGEQPQLITLALAAVLLSAFSVGALVHTNTALSATPLKQAPQKSKIELELEKKKPAPSPTEDRPAKRRSTPSSERVVTAKDYSVSFISDAVGADILVDGTAVGKTGPDKRLITRVKRGQHRAMVSMKGYNPNSMTISVVSDRMVYTLNLGTPLPAPTPAPTPAANAEPTPESTASPAPVTADDILNRFIDPKESNKVTIDEWKSLISQTEEGLKEDPNQGRLTARLHLGRGQIAYLDNNYAEALTEFNRAIVALPQSGIAYYGLGNVYLATKQPTQAIKTYQQAYQLTPETTAIALRGIGDALVQLEKPKEAGTSYLRARERGNEGPEINKGIALSHIKQKQWQKALAELEPIEGSDNDGQIHLYLGECYENLKRPLSAYRAYLAATKLAPNSPLAFSRLGTLLFEQNEFPEAKDALERALALDTSGTTINRHVTRKLADQAAAESKPKQ
jgi:Flp pilus assembly protein TadD